MDKILVVEDDLDIQDILKNYLEDAGYQVVLAGDGVEGIAKFSPDITLVLLDVLLPKIDGYGVCEVIRRQSEVPVVMLTALSEEADQLKGFACRIDDYVAKPFSVRVLLHKIQAILRRSHPEAEPQVQAYRNIRLDSVGYQVLVDGQEIVLTHKEFELLQTFLGHPGQVFTRTMLLDRIWGMDAFVEERIVDSHIKNLRKKLGVDYIETIRGVGYRIEKER